MKNNDLRVVPVQKLCVICTEEMPARDGAQGVAGRLCSACITMIREQVLRDVERQPKIVRV